MSYKDLFWWSDLAWHLAGHFMGETLVVNVDGWYLVLSGVECHCVGYICSVQCVSIPFHYRARHSSQPGWHPAQFLVSSLLVMLLCAAGWDCGYNRQEKWAKVGRDMTADWSTHSHRSGQRSCWLQLSYDIKNHLKSFTVSLWHKFANTRFFL